METQTTSPTKEFAGVLPAFRLFLPWVLSLIHNMTTQSETHHLLRYTNTYNHSKHSLDSSLYWTSQSPGEEDATYLNSWTRNHWLSHIRFRVLGSYRIHPSIEVSHSPHPTWCWTSCFLSDFFSLASSPPPGLPTGHLIPPRENWYMYIFLLKMPSVYLSEYLNHDGSYSPCYTF